MQNLSNWRTLFFYMRTCFDVANFLEICEVLKKTNKTLFKKKKKTKCIPEEPSKKTTEKAGSEPFSKNPKTVFAVV